MHNHFQPCATECEKSDRLEGKIADWLQSARARRIQVRQTPAQDFVGAE